MVPELFIRSEVGVAFRTFNVLLFATRLDPSDERPDES